MEGDVSVPTNAQRFVQKTLSLIFRAGLSSVPLAALVWDLAQLQIDLANERVTSKFLEELAERLERMEKRGAGMDAKLGDAAAHVARKALERLVLENDQTFAADLARAVSQLEAGQGDDEAKRQYALVLVEVHKRDVVSLGAIARANDGTMTAIELSTLAQVQQLPAGTLGNEATFDYGHALEYLLSAHSPSIDPTSGLARLKRLGLITLPDVRLCGSDLSPDRLPGRITKVGRTVLSLFLEDPNAIPPYSLLHKASDVSA